MRRVFDGFIGSELVDQILEYAGTDTEYKFLEALDFLPETWYYRQHSINYYYNKHGHRCKNISEIDLSNYILVAGGSITEGVGLELEKTYGYLVAEHFECDYYNLALGGCGIDIMIYNVLYWLITIEKKPKIIILHWPDQSRFTAISKENHITSHGSWSNNKDVTNFIVGGEDVGYFTLRSKLNFNLISQFANANNIKLVNLREENSTTNPEFITIKTLDYARDRVHPGIESHKQLSSNIISNLL